MLRELAPHHPRQSRRQFPWRERRPWQTGQTAALHARSMGALPGHETAQADSQAQ